MKESWTFSEVDVLLALIPARARSTKEVVSIAFAVVYVEKV